MKNALIFLLAGCTAFSGDALALEATANTPESQLSNLSAQMQIDALKSMVQIVINQINTCNTKGEVFTPSTTVPGRDADGCIVPVDIWSKGSGNSIYYNLGNVGIGTSSPTQKLDVSGTILARGGIQFNDGTLQTTAASMPNATSCPAGAGLKSNGTSWSCEQTFGVPTNACGGTLCLYDANTATHLCQMYGKQVASAIGNGGSGCSGCYYTYWAGSSWAGAFNGCNSCSRISSVTCY